MSGAASAVSGAGGAPTRDGYLRSTFKHGAIYGVESLLAKAIGFVMLPIYTQVLTPADYGVLELLSMTVDVIALVTGAGLTWSVTRYYYYYDTLEEKRAVVSSAAMLLVALFGTASTTTLLFARPLSGLILGDSSYAHLVRLATVGFFLLSFIEIPMAFLRAKQASKHVVVVGLVRLTLALSLNILFVVVMRLGVAGVLYSTIISSAVAGGYLTASTLRETGLRFSRSIAGKLVAFGAPIIAANLGSFVIHFSDRYLLRVYGSLESVGLYSLAYKFAMLLSLFIATPFGQIWAPKALEIHKAEGEAARPILRRIISHYNIVLVAGALALALFAGDAIRIMASAEFHAAGETVPLLCLGMLFFGYRQISYIGASIRERSDLIAAGRVFGALVVVAANLALIPHWGATGAAAATAVAFGAEFVVMMTASERVYRIGISIPGLFTPVVLAAAVFLLTQVALPAGTPVYATVPVKIAALVLFAAALILHDDRSRQWARKLNVRTFRLWRSIDHADGRG